MALIMSLAGVLEISSFTILASSDVQQVYS